MDTFSTVLFVDSDPVGYMVHRKSDRIVLHPAENPTRETEAPKLELVQRNGQWTVRGTQNPELINQVLEELAVSQSDIPESDFSAAP